MKKQKCLSTKCEQRGYKETRRGQLTHIFLDESGNLGFDFNKSGTSRYFVITILVAKQFAPIASAIHRTVKAKLRQKKKTRYVNELKGNSTTFSIKNYFHQQMLRYDDWHLHTIILDKTTLIHQEVLKNSIDRLYNLLAKNVLHGVSIPTNESVVHLHVDRSKEQNEIVIFNRSVRSHLEPNIPSNCTFNIDHLRSQNDAGLQAVDLFCYGIAKKYEKGDTQWHDIFQDKIKKRLIFRP